LTTITKQVIQVIYIQSVGTIDCVRVVLESHIVDS